MISCLLVTSPGREAHIRASMTCFAGQTVAQRELVIVHDGDVACQESIVNLASGFPESDIRVFAEAPGQTLGALRNASIGHARYPLICQWDDDDLYHPERLERQQRGLVEAGADFCFLTDQLHLFSDGNLLFWDDWSVETWPGNCIQGTLLGRRDRMALYPDLPRGEDTGLLHELVAADRTLVTLSGLGWLYIYIYHGSNAWELEHHKAISQWKRLKYDALARRLPLLEAKLREYPVMPEKLVLLHDQGRFEIATGDLSGQSR
jgi:glycosyltransferase involved in cell wall biosynthesis